MEFTKEKAKQLLEKYLAEIHDVTVKEYRSISDATGEIDAQTRTISVEQSDGHFRTYIVDERGSELTALK